MIEDLGGDRGDLDRRLSLAEDHLPDGAAAFYPVEVILDDGVIDARDDLTARHAGGQTEAEYELQVDGVCGEQPE